MTKMIEDLNGEVRDLVKTEKRATTDKTIAERSAAQMRTRITTLEKNESALKATIAATVCNTETLTSLQKDYNALVQSKALVDGELVNAQQSHSGELSRLRRDQQVDMCLKDAEIARMEKELAVKEAAMEAHLASEKAEKERVEAALAEKERIRQAARDLLQEERLGSGGHCQDGWVWDWYGGYGKGKGGYGKGTGGKGGKGGKGGEGESGGDWWSTDSWWH